MVPQPTILLAHAELDTRAALSAPLAAAGYLVAAVASGGECLRLAGELRPAVALVALDLPDQDGVAVCRALRAAPGASGALRTIITSAPPSDTAAAALADIVDTWLVHPFSDPEILALVRLQLRTYAAEQRAPAPPAEQRAPTPPAELLYQSIVQSAIDGFWIVRASDARFLDVNEAYCQMSGYSRDELLAMRISDIEAVERPEETSERIERIRRQGFDRFATCHRRKDGTLIDVEVSVRTVEHDETLMVVFARDVSVSTQAEERLRHSEARYRNLLSAIPDRVFRHDSEGRFIDFHTPRDAPLLVPPDAFLGKHYREVLPPAISEPFSVALADARRSGEPQRFEYELPAPDGTTASYETRLVSSEDGDVVTIVRDITEQRQTEATRERLARELVRKNRELEQIVYVASHDLRSPLVNLQGFSRELQASTEELAQSIADVELVGDQRDQIRWLAEHDIPESLGFILAGVSKMDALLKGLLRLSRLGRAAISIRPLEVAPIVAETLAAFDFQIKQAGATVEVGALPPCSGDAVQIGQVFANLLSNALKYLSPRRPGQITITGERAEGMAVYRVADNGIGIAREQHDKIFELYYRLAPAQSEGEGLGLTIVRTIVDRHGGWIRVTSTPDKGSQFVFALPEAR